MASYFRPLHFVSLVLIIVAAMSTQVFAQTYSLSFSGGSASIPNSGAPLGSASRTIEFKLKTTGSGWSLGYGTRSAHQHFCFWDQNQGTFGLSRFYDDAITGVSVTNNVWHHMAATLRNDTLRCYLDGLLIYTYPGFTVNTTGSTHTINSPYGNSQLTLYSDIRVWNYARSGDQIRANINTVFSLPETGLVGYWKLNEGTGSVISNSVPGGSSGTISGGTWSTDVPPVISLQYPNGFETFCIGTEDSIKWTSSGVMGTVNVELNRNYPIGNWESLYSNLTNSGCVSWTPSAPPSSNVRIRVISNDSLLIGDTTNSNLSILSSVEWPICSRLTRSELKRIVSTSTNDICVVGDSGSIHRSTNNGVSWSQQTSNVNLRLNSVSFYSSSNGWIVGNSGTILYSSNGGGSWNIQTSGTNSHFLDIFAMDANNAWAIGNQGTIRRAMAGGWTIQNSGVTNSLNGIYFTSNSTGWVVGSSGTVLQTVNSGANWSRQTIYTQSNLKAVSFSDQNNGWIVGDSGLVLYTPNRGANWVFQTSGVTANLNCISVVDSNTCVIGGDLGVILKTTDRGLSWLRQSCGTSGNINSISMINQNSGFATSSGGIVLRYSNSLWIKDDTYSGTPQQFLLKPIYPNPFNSSTTISFSLPKTSDIELKLYDLNGREVKSLVLNERQAPGTYRFTLDGKDSSTGTYFVRMRAGEFVQTQKIVLLK
ncbi:MAG: YCF48-related protein [bacterium]|nr:YCF48-related protein [bacterium]